MPDATITASDTRLRRETARVIAPPPGRPSARPSDDALRANYYSVKAAHEECKRLHAERQARRWRTAFCVASAAGFLLCGGGLWTVAAGVGLVVAAVLTAQTEGTR